MQRITARRADALERITRPGRLHTSTRVDVWAYLSMRNHINGGGCARVGERAGTVYTPRPLPLDIPGRVLIRYSITDLSTYGLKYLRGKDGYDT